MQSYPFAMATRLRPLRSPRERRGFTLLEAAVAMMIIGIASIGTLGAFAADLRAADRLSALEIAGSWNHSVPDSLAHGRFAPPFDAYSWTASVRAVPSTFGLVEIRTEIGWDGGSFDLIERRFQASVVRAESVR